MSYPVKYKMEAVINGWLAKGAYSELTGFTYYKGQRQDAQQLPCVVTSVDSVEPAWDLQEGAASWDAIPRKIQVTVRVKGRVSFSAAHSATTSETAHYDAAERVEKRLGDNAGIRTYASVDNVTDRPVTSFYLYDIQPPRVYFDHDAENDCFITSLVFQAMAQATDAT